MEGKECSDILEAISTLKGEIAVLKSEQRNTKDYIFKEMKPDMEKLYTRMGWLVGGTFTLSIAIFSAVFTIIVSIL